MMSDGNLFEEVKGQADLLQIVGHFSEGKISGHGNKRQLSMCPFCDGHGCFSMSLDKQLFNCFQCDAPNTGGDIYTFMVKLRGYDRFSALKEIAEHIAYVLPEKSKPLKWDIRDEIALKLKDDWKLPEAKPFWEYLVSTRKLSPEILKDHDVGFYCGQQNMINYLFTRGFKFAEIKASGILTRHFGAFYRIIFSWRGKSGKIEGFVGAARKDQLGEIADEEKDNYPKYKNNFDFHTTAPFNLYFAKRWVPRDLTLIFVEGIVDCLHLLSIGINNVMALGGSAFEENFIKVIQETKFQRLIFLLDADPAGTKATRRMMEMIWESGAAFSLYVAEIMAADPDNDGQMIKDPDELIKKLGAENMRAVISDPVRAGSWLIGVMWGQSDMKSPLHRDQVLEEIGKLWFLIKDDIEKKEMLVVLSRACGIPQDSLLKTIERYGNEKRAVQVISSISKEKEGVSQADKDLIKKLKEELADSKKEIKQLKQEKKLVLTAYASFVVYVKALAKARVIWHLERISVGHVSLLKMIKKKSDGVQNKIKAIEAIFSSSNLTNRAAIQEDLSQLIKEGQKEE